MRWRMTWPKKKEKEKKKSTPLNIRNCTELGAERSSRNKDKQGSVDNIMLNSMYTLKKKAI